MRPANLTKPYIGNLRKPQIIRTPGRAHRITRNTATRLAPGPNAHRPRTGAKRLFIYPLLQTPYCNQMFVITHKEQTTAHVPAPHGASDRGEEEERVTIGKDMVGEAAGD